MRIYAALAVGCMALGPGASPRPAATAPAAITFNDNRSPAGIEGPETLRVSLVAARGEWRPYGPDSSGVPMLVFGETGKPLQDPGPLLRVRRGTRLTVAVRNLTGAPLVVHGLSARRVTVMDTLVVAPGAVGTAAFMADAEGTYYYWASTHGEGFDQRFLDDSHLNGALIVDPPAPAVPAPDRVFVVELYTPDMVNDTTPDFDHMLFAINGRPWPFTERLTYDVGDSVRWRFINASADVHPFHLHGFFFRVNARGDLQRDTVYWPDQQRHAVTEVMWNGTTMDMAWRPDRPGGWIFHCHFNFHVPPNAALPPDTEPSPLRELHLARGYPGMGMTGNHAMTGMGGLVLGIYIHPPAGWHPYAGARRTLRLLVESDSARGDSNRTYRYEVDDGSHVATTHAPQPYGPPIILHRGEPTRIWIVNHTPEMTQVHWHGLEVESGVDGVVGVSGTPASMEPGIMPGDSYPVLVTPPHAGSYMYHTHVNDIHQQTNGLYGPLVVLDSGQTWNPDTDRYFIVGDDAAFVPVVNGGDTLPIVLRTGTPYRFRLMNMSVLEFNVRFQLVKNGALLQWTPVAKDAWPLPPWQRASASARQAVSIGETYDFQVEQADTGRVTLELRRLSGVLLSRQPIRFVPP